MLNTLFYKNKTILVTGHTGFKGCWLCKILINLGAKVIGYSLEPNADPNLYELSGIADNMVSIFGDIRDFNKLKSVFDQYKPELVIHMAAQAFVGVSYENPKYTFDVNVGGTVNVLECIRLSNTVKSFLNVTTDKVYYNDDNVNVAFRESDELKGTDPYSNSKSCSELVTYSYQQSFKDIGCKISTARAGNVIGGGDFSKDRIVPNCIRSILSEDIVILRNPYSIRPYQHVLEPLMLYLEIMEKQYSDSKYEGNYNIGPCDDDNVTTKDIIKMISIKSKKKIIVKYSEKVPFKEADCIKLNTEKVCKTFNWTSKWNIDKAIEMTIKWYDVFWKNRSLISCEMDKEIEEYLTLSEK